MKQKYLVGIIIIFLVSGEFLQATDGQKQETYLFASSKNPIDYQGFLQVWKPSEKDETNQMVCEFQEECRSAYFVGFFHDNHEPRLVVTQENSAKIFSLDGKSQAVVLSPEVVAPYNDSENIASRIDALAIVQEADYPRILCGTQHGYIYKYSARTGELENIFAGVQANNGDAFGITCFALYEFEGIRYLVVGSSNQTVRIYNYFTGNEYKTFDAGSSVTSLAVFKNGSEINIVAGLVGSSPERSPNQGEIICWDFISGKEKYKKPCFSDKDSTVQGLILVSNETDGKNPVIVIPIIRDEYFRSYNASTGDLVNLFHNQDLQEGLVADIKPFFDKQNKEIQLVAAYSNGVVAAWSLSGELIKALKYDLSSEIRSLCLFEHEGGELGAFCTPAGLIVVFCLSDLRLVNQARVQGFLMESLLSNKEISNHHLFFVSRDTQLTQGSRVQYFDLNNLKIINNGFEA